MAVGSLVPIVVGVGDIKNRSQKVEDAIEPMQLMLQAALKAIKDIGLSEPKAKILQSTIDSVSVVATWTWDYPDLPGLLSENLGVKPSYKVLSGQSGNSPAKLFDEAARRISLGESKVAIVTGGEALASCKSGHVQSPRQVLTLILVGACAAAHKIPPPGWTPRDKNARKMDISDVSVMGKSTFHSLGLPIQIYPLYENGFRAHRGQSISENHQESAQLYASFAKVAEKMPLAWNYGQPATTMDDIGTVSKKNRMICFPYPLLMNAFNNINLAGACILTSTDYARKLGIPESKWIYPLGGAGTSDSGNFCERPNFYSSPSISRSLDAGLKASGLSKENVDLFDFYSCFPIIPKLACEHLGFSSTNPPKPITLLGGLTSFGGAGNNYSMHALIEMVRQLRSGKGHTGLVLANGGVATYQHVICLSSRARNSSYPPANPLPEFLTDEPGHAPAPAIDEKATGEATIETYTVEFNRSGVPTRGYVVGRLKSNDHRFIANDADIGTLQQLASTTKEPIGRSGWVETGEDGRNLFSFHGGEKL
ncbi:hypothetical protein LHYA1_G004532 [Lachnellula hyalina]|uniref:Thiolase-like protein type 1 additional C-terminal domain-containing protein n=1 Tax=Lachnellula hyalina TaxID=1316788 RepID=A0A8H8R2Q4_9HELO|nr:uncharacterized protein LHYA1_G004532 [Lachnellula hyalina]TVY26586.1 hypothetical protein LHYA1_G004532 [Lachnellula hyalina]